jgi:hypothetical protein
MVCPECGAGYRSGITRCSDRDVALIDSPEHDHVSVPAILAYWLIGAALGMLGSL